MLDPLLVFDNKTYHANACQRCFLKLEQFLMYFGCSKQNTVECIVLPIIFRTFWVLNKTHRLWAPKTYVLGEKQENIFH